jgi:hypothetical protein
VSSSALKTLKALFHHRFRDNIQHFSPPDNTLLGFKASSPSEENHLSLGNYRCLPHTLFLVLPGLKPI